MALVVKNPPANAGDIKSVGLIAGSGRSPGGIFQKGMATHFNILAWRIPWTEEPGGYRLLSHRVGHDQNYLAHMHTYTLKHFWMHFLLLPIPHQWPLPLQGSIPGEPSSFSLGPGEADLSLNHILKDSHSNQSREANLPREWEIDVIESHRHFWDCYSL